MFLTAPARVFRSWMSLAFALVLLILQPGCMVATRRRQLIPPGWRSCVRQRRATSSLPARRHLHMASAYAYPLCAEAHPRILAAGTMLRFALWEQISSRELSPGNRVEFRLRNAVPLAAGCSWPAGAQLWAKVVALHPAGLLHGNGWVRLRFEQIVFMNGAQRPFHAQLAGSDGASGVRIGPHGRLTQISPRSTLLEAGRCAALPAASMATAGWLLRRPAGSTALDALAIWGTAALAQAVLRRQPDLFLPAGCTWYLRLSAPLPIPADAQRTVP